MTLKFFNSNVFYLEQQIIEIIKIKKSIFKFQEPE